MYLLKLSMLSMLSMCCLIIAIIFWERHTKQADYHVSLVILLIKYMLNKALDTKDMLN